MNRDDIIRMAREAGFTREDHHAIDVQLQLFAALVAAAEREACAKVCYEVVAADRTGYGIAEDCAAAIRARGAQPAVREWVGLTEDEVWQVYYDLPVDIERSERVEFARAIEAKLKEKNT